MMELRWDPTLEEWVIIASHRSERTFFPPADYCPLCPSKKGKPRTEIPSSDYEIVVFENKFPSLCKSVSNQPSVDSEEKKLYQRAAAKGICEVICYTPRHNLTLTDLPTDSIENLILVWQDRYRELGKYPFIKYVFIFENKGKEIGVTLSHPHGQIYGYPFIPPKIKKELKSSSHYFRKNRKCLFCEIVRKEKKEKKRIISHNEDFLAFVPFYAHFPYEVHIFPEKHLTSFHYFKKRDLRNLAEIMKNVLVRYDKIFNFSFPYIMNIHQAPTDGREYPDYHFHIEFYPCYRAKNRLKYLAGSEEGAGVFIGDILPEDQASQLRITPPPISSPLEGEE